MFSAHACAFFRLVNAVGATGVTMYDELVKQQIHDDLNNGLPVTLVDTICALFGNSIMVTTHIEGINVKFQENARDGIAWQTHFL